MAVEVAFSGQGFVLTEQWRDWLRPLQRDVQRLGITFNGTEEECSTVGKLLHQLTRLDVCNST